MNGFQFPELIIESVLRDGQLNCQADTTIIPDLFAQLTRGYAATKYGTAEIARIQTIINAKQIPVVFSYFDVDAKSPCISIMVGSDDEAKNLARLNDHELDQDDPITDSGELAALIKVPSFQPTAYDIFSGKVSVMDNVDLSPVFLGYVYEDASGNEWPVGGGVDNTDGQKAFFILNGSTPDISGPGVIKSTLDYTRHEVKGVTGDVKLVIGIHARDALLCKWLYVLVKYWILSRKYDIIKRGLFLATYNGSDFNRNQEYTGDRVFTRFITISGKVEDTWRADQVKLIDSFIIEPVPVE